MNLLIKQNKKLIQIQFLINTYYLISLLKRVELRFDTFDENTNLDHCVQTFGFFFIHLFTYNILFFLRILLGILLKLFQKNYR